MRYFHGSLLCFLFHYIILISYLTCCAGEYRTINERISPDDIDTASVDDFRKLLFDGNFVDKSLLINETLSHSEKVFQITRPQKWGKTLNLNMLKRFFEIEFDHTGCELPEKSKQNVVLFKGGKAMGHGESKVLKPLKVSFVESAISYVGKHPVIYLDLKDVHGSSVGEIGNKMKSVVVHLFSSYPWLNKYLENSSSLLDADEKERLRNFMTGNLETEYVYDFLEFLSMILFEHFNSYVCLFIDNYDLPVINVFLKCGDRGKEFDFVEEMLRSIYHYAFKENQYLLKAVITGTLNFDIVPSGSSEFEYRFILYNTVLDQEFIHLYGFTKEEVEELLKKGNLTFNLAEVKKWFGGLHLNGKEIFNPLSIMKFISSKGKFDYFFKDHGESAVVNFMNRAFLSEKNQEDLHLLATGKEIIRTSLDNSTSLRNIAGDFCGLSVHTGYLNFVPPDQLTENPIWRMNVPNLEVRGIFAQSFKLWTAKELDISGNEYENLMRLLITGKGEAFGEKLQGLLLKLSKFSTKPVEESYHNLMSGIAASLGLGYLVDSIKLFGENTGENVIIPLEGRGRCAINIEYSICKPWQNAEAIAKTSLESLSNRPKTCTAKIRAYSHVTKIFYLAIVFSGPKVTLKSTVVKIR